MSHPVQVDVRHVTFVVTRALCLTSTSSEIPSTPKRWRDGKSLQNPRCHDGRMQNLQFTMKKLVCSSPTQRSPPLPNFLNFLASASPTRTHHPQTRHATTLRPVSAAHSLPTHCGERPAPRNAPHLGSTPPPSNVGSRWVRLQRHRRLPSRGAGEEAEGVKRGEGGEKKGFGDKLLRPNLIIVNKTKSSACVPLNPCRRRHLFPCFSLASTWHRCS